MNNLPHFIIIGAMKSATSTLAGQLALQSGIFMTEPKEPNFFSDDSIYNKGIAWYQSLFSSAAEADLLGEASTHYSKLPTHPLAIERIKQHVPNARFIYVMRHPVDRLVSHYIHQWSMGIYRCDINEAVNQYPEMLAYGKYAEQLSPYIDAFGRASILPIFFDRLIHFPQEELERVCDFIGYQGKPEWQFDLEASNVSSQRIRKFPLYSLLIESTLATWLRQNLIPRALRDRVKSKLTMKKRPQLTQKTLEALTDEFDKDLYQVGQWLNVDLKCSSFKQLTKQDSIDWKSI